MITIAARKPGAKKEVNLALREEWLRTVEDLQQQIIKWAIEEPEWSVSGGDTHQIQEEPLGSYAVTDLHIFTPEGKLILEPIARNFPGRGIVELFAWPTLFRVRLLWGNADTDWKVRVDSGFNLHQDWNRDNFIQLVNDLLGAT